MAAISCSTPATPKAKASAPIAQKESRAVAVRRLRAAGRNLLFRNETAGVAGNATAGGEPPIDPSCLAGRAGILDDRAESSQRSPLNFIICIRLLMR